MPDAGYQMPDTGGRIPDAGYRRPEAGYQMPDAGCRMPDAGCQARRYSGPSCVAAQVRQYQPSPPSRPSRGTAPPQTMQRPSTKRSARSRCGPSPEKSSWTRMAGRVLLMGTARVAPSPVQANEVLRSRRRALRTLDLDGRLNLQLHPALDRLHLDQFHPGPDPRADPDRGDESHPVEPAVDRHLFSLLIPADD